jgi:hypothetical protein
MSRSPNCNCNKIYFRVGPNGEKDYSAWDIQAKAYGPGDPETVLPVEFSDHCANTFMGMTTDEFFSRDATKNKNFLAKKKATEVTSNLFRSSMIYISTLSMLSIADNACTLSPQHPPVHGCHLLTIRSPGAV